MGDCTHILLLSYSLDDVTALRAKLWQCLHTQERAYLAYCIIYLGKSDIQYCFRYTSIKRFFILLGIFVSPLTDTAARCSFMIATRFFLESGKCLGHWDCGARRSYLTSFVAVSVSLSMFRWFRYPLSGSLDRRRLLTESANTV